MLDLCDDYEDANIRQIAYKDQYSNSFAFSSVCLQVTMLDKSAAERACKDPNPIIDGRKANVNLAYLGAKPRSPLTGKHQTHA